MLSAVAVASIIATARADCTWDTTAGFLNYGVNRGGCWSCDVSSDFSLVNVCREKCLEDWNCKSFETAFGGLDYYNFDGWGINCCIEYANSDDISSNNYWVHADSLHGRCAEEANLWTTHEPANHGHPASTCDPAAGINTGVCTLVDCCVSWDANHAEWARGWIQDGCAEGEDEDDGDVGLMIGIIAGVVAVVLIGVCGVIVVRARKARAPDDPPALVQATAASSPPQEIQLGIVVGTEKPRFDPNTGKPIPDDPPKPKFDPYTGAPIPKFDPQTGVQNW